MWLSIEPVADGCAHDRIVFHKMRDPLSKQQTVNKNSSLGCQLCNKVSETNCVPDDNAVCMSTVLFTPPFPQKIISHSTTGGVRTLPRFNLVDCI